MYKVAYQRLISAIWVTRFEDNGDGTAKLLSYQREREVPPGAVPGRPLEKDGRIVTAIQLFDSQYHEAKEIERLSVTNQKHVFSYNGDE